MEIKNWSQPIDRGVYMGVTSGAKSPVEAAGQPAHNTDQVVISQEARRAVTAAEPEVDSNGGGTAQGLASGKFTVVEPDWDSFEVHTLQGQSDEKIYHTAYLEAYLKEINAISDQVQSYYTPKFASLGGMSTAAARAHLFETYKLPWMKDVFMAGTDIPRPPEGMSQDEANMTYDQLYGMLFTQKAPILRDPYALGAEGIERLNNVEKHAHESAQKVYDAAQKEYEAEQETWKVQQKERAKRMYQSLGSGNTSSMGSMALRSEGSSGG